MQIKILKRIASTNQPTIFSQVPNNTQNMCPSMSSCLKASVHTHMICDLVVMDLCKSKNLLICTWMDTIENATFVPNLFQTAAR